MAPLGHHSYLFCLPCKTMNITRRSREKREKEKQKQKSYSVVKKELGKRSFIYDACKKVKNSDHLPLLLSATTQFWSGIPPPLGCL